jgi:hypothetical protein
VPRFLLPSLVLFPALFGACATGQKGADASKPTANDQQVRMVNEDRVQISRVSFVRCTYGSLESQRAISLNALVPAITALVARSSARTITFWSPAVGQGNRSGAAAADASQAATVNPGGEFVKVTVWQCPQTLALATNLIIDGGAADPPVSLGSIASTFPEAAPNLFLLDQDALRLRQEVTAGRTPLSRALREITQKHLGTIRSVLGAVKLDDKQTMLAADGAYGDYVGLTARSVEQGFRTLTALEQYVLATYAQSVPPAAMAYWAALREALGQFREARQTVAKLTALAQSRKIDAQEARWQDAKSRNACTTASRDRQGSEPSEKEMCDLMVASMERGQQFQEDIARSLPADLGPMTVALKWSQSLIEAYVTRFVKLGRCEPEANRPSHLICRYDYSLAYKNTSKFSELLGNRGYLPDHRAYYKDSSGEWDSVETLAQEAARIAYQERRRLHQEAIEKWERCRQSRRWDCGDEPNRFLVP